MIPVRCTAYSGGLKQLINNEETVQKSRINTTKLRVHGKHDALLLDCVCTFYARLHAVLSAY